MYLLASAINRMSENAQETGFVYLIDWPRKQVVHSVTTQDRSLTKGFWNPRGGNRGARGIAYFNNKIYVATATSIKVYDTNLKQLDEINNPNFASLHDIYVGKEGILVVATAHDAIIKVDFSGKEKFIWRGSESLILQTILKYTGRPHIRPSHKINEMYLSTNRLHLSGVAVVNSDIYTLSGKYGAMIKFNPSIPNSEEIVIDAKSVLVSPHNIVVTKQKNFLINNTRLQQLCLYSPKGQLLSYFNTKVYATDKVNMFSTPGWQRGLAHMYKSIYFVGTSPFTIFTADMDRKLVLEKMQISSQLSMAAYSLCVMQ